MRQLGLLLSSLFLITTLSAKPSLVQSHGAFLGVNSYQLDRQKARVLGFNNEYGEYITYVYEKTPADEIGLLPFDYIYGIGEYRTSSDRDLSDMLRKFNPGDEVDIQIIRDGKPLALQVKLGEKKYREKPHLSDSENPHLGIWEKDEADKNRMGVAISVSRYGLASDLGLRTRDRVLMFDGYPIVDYKDLITAIDMTEVGSDFEVVYERGDQQFSAKGTMVSKTMHEKNVKEGKKIGNPFIGVNLDVVSSSKAKELGFPVANGSYVTSIVPNTAAEKAGLQPFDYIYGIDDEMVSKHINLGNLIDYYKPGEKANLKIVRKGKEIAVPITFGRRADAGKKPDLGCKEAFFGVTYNDIASDRKGVGVNITDESSAERLGLKDRDIILFINDYQIVDFTDVSTAIDMLRAGDNIKVKYERKGEIMEGQTEIGNVCDRSDNDWNWSWNNDREEREERETREDRERGDARPNGQARPTITRPAIAESFEAIDMDNVQVDMKDMPADEAKEMKEQYGVDMPLDNDLNIDQLQLFPNPSEGLFNLEFELPERAETTIRIFNSSGRSIYNYELGQFSGAFEDQVNISQNGAGAYFLEIRQGSKSIVKKVILANR